MKLLTKLKTKIKTGRQYRPHSLNLSRSQQARLKSLGIKAHRRSRKLSPISLISPISPSLKGQASLILKRFPRFSLIKLFPRARRAKLRLSRRAKLRLFSLKKLRRTWRKPERKRRLLAIGLILLTILIPLVYLTLFNPDPAAAWFDDAYGYRQQFSFTHNADISTERRVTLSLDTAELIAAGVMQSDCDDTRFTNLNGLVLRYELTGTCNNAATTYEVVYPSIINGTNPAYIYYGNPAATSASEDTSGFTDLTPSGGDPAITDRTSEEKGPSPNAYWKFDEGYGTVANDSTPNANNATLGGGLTVIEQQVNIIDQESTTTAMTYGPTDNSLGLIQFDGTKYTGDTVYFEAVIKRSGGTTNSIFTNNLGHRSMDCPTADDCKIAYHDDGDGSLRFFDCDDATCSTGTITILDGAQGCSLTGGDNCDTYPTDTDDTGYYPSIDCPTATDCKIAYWNSTEGALFFGDCDDATCSTGSMQMLDGDTTVTCALTGGDNCDTYPTDTGDTGYYPSIDCSAGAADCKIAYFSNAEDALFFADCDDATCSTGSMQMLDGDTTVTCALTGGDNCDTYPTDTDATGLYPSIDCPTAADCKIAYRNSSESALFFADCDDATCSTGSMQMLDGDDTVTCALTGGDNCDTYPTDTDITGFNPSIDCPTATDCKIAYRNSSESALFFADCDDATCSTGSMQMLDGDETVTCALTGGDNCDTYPTDTDNTGYYPSIDCPTATDCKIAYYNSTESALFFADCDDATCSTGSMQMLDGDDTVTCALTGGENCDTSTDTDSTGWTPSMDCPTATDCKITYFNNTRDDLFFGDCDNASCSSGSMETVDDGTDFAQVGLFDDTGNIVTAIQTTSTTYSRVRKAVGLSLTDGEEYTVRAKSSETIFTTAFVQAARLIIVQSASIITDTQTQVEAGNNETTTATSDTQLTDKKIYLFDGTQFSGAETVYFEATLSNNTGGNSATASLYNDGGSCTTQVTGSEVTVTGTTWDRQRSAALTLTDNQAYMVCLRASATTARIAHAKIIIEQSAGDGITNVELVHQYNNTLATDTNSTYTSQDFDNSFDKANLSGGTFTVYFESTLKTSNGANAYFARLDTPLGEVTGTDTSYTRNRNASDLWSSLPASATDIDVQLRNAAASGTTTSSSTSWLIIQASGLPGAGEPARWETEDLCLTGKCLFFNGTDNAALVTNASSIDLDGQLAGAFTFQAWVRANSDGEGNVGQIFNKGSATYLRITNEGTDGLADLEASVDLNGTGDATLTVTNGITLNRWHHVAVGYTDDGDDEITVYIDAASQGSSSGGDGVPVADSSNLLIGGPTTANFHGFIDEFKIYKEERTAAETKTDFLRVSSLRGASASFGSRDLAFLSDGLVGYWKMDESSGNASDSSGNATTLTNTATTTYTGAKFGNGAEPNGTTQYFDAVDNADLSVTGSLTLSAWIEPDDTTGSQDIVGKWDGANESYLLAMEGANLRMYVDSVSNFEATTATPLSGNSETHVAGTYDAASQTVRLFVNGNLEASSTTGTIPASIADDAGEFDIGAEDSSTTAVNFFDGHIDDVRVYNRAFTPSEVEGLYNHGPEPVGYWPLDENTGTTTVYDRSTNENAGTMNGSMTESDWVPGRYGPALDLDGTDDNISVSDDALYDFAAADDFTIEAWGKRTQQATVTGATATYYFDAYDAGGEEWTTTPANMADGSETTFATTSVDLDVELLNSNTSAGVNLGTITKVEMRVKAFNDTGDNGDLILRPVFNGTTDCPTSTFDPPETTAAWSAYFDITNTGACTGWDWTELDNLDMDVVWDVIGGADIGHASKVELRLTYDAPADDDYLITKVDTTNGGYKIWMDDTGDFCFGIDDDTTWTPDDSACTSAVDYDDNAWHHAVGVKTATTRIDLYVDGVVVASDTTIAATGTLENTNALYFGVDRDGTSNDWEGQVDDIRIYNYARTSGQIVEDMNAGHPTAGSPLGSQAGYWKFDEGYGTTANDSSVNQNNATFGGTSTIEQQINIIDQESTTTAITYGPTDNSLGLIQFDGTKYTGETVYFEAVIQRSGGTANTIYTHNDGHRSIDCPTADDCKIVYHDDTDGSLRFFDCDDATCSTGTITILDGAQGCSLTGGDNCDTYPTDTDDTGRYPSIDCSAGAADCKIAYYNATEGALFFGDCDDATCSTGSMQMLDGDDTVTCALTGGDNCDTYPTDTDDTGRYPSIDCSAGAADCKVAYRSWNESALFFADCDDATCSTGSMQMLDGDTTVTCALTGGDNCQTYPTNFDSTGLYPSIDCSAGAADCKIAYYNGTEQALFFADCDNATCSTGSMQILDGDDHSLLPCALTGGDNCDTYPTETDSTGEYPSIDCSAGATDCKVAYYNATEGALFFGDCDDATCSTGSMQMLDGDTTVTCALTGGDNCDTYPTDTDFTGFYPSLDCSAGATDCKVAYWNFTERALFFGDCDDATCSTGSIQMLDGDTTVTCALTGGDNCDTYPTDTDITGYYPSIDCSAGATDCKVAYFNDTRDDLFFGDCDNGSCSSGSMELADDGTDFSQVGLFDDTGNIVTAIQTTATSYTRVRKAVGLSLTDGEEYTVRVKSSETTNTTAFVQAARLIIPQSATSITDTQTQVEVGNNDTTTSTTDAPLTDKKIYRFDGTKFSGSETVYFEATLSNNTGGNSATASLYNDGASCSTQVTGSEVTVTGTTWDRQRSAAITLSDNQDYMVCLRASATTARIANAKIIIEQTGGVTDVELIHQYINTKATETGASYVAQDFDNLYDSNNFRGGSFTYLFEATLQNNGGTSNARLTPGALGNVSGSASYTRQRSASITPVDDTAYDTEIANADASSSWLIIQVSALVPAPDWQADNLCKLNKCLDFDGSTDVATVTNTASIDLNDNLSSGFTFSAWVYADTAGEGTGGQIFWKGANTWLRVDTLSGSNLDVETSLDLATSDATLNVSAPITTATWHYVAVSWTDDGDDEITIWINGISRGTSTNGDGAPAADTNNLLIGGTTTNNFDGRLDQFKVYNSELTPAQIKVDFTAGSALALGGVLGTQDNEGFGGNASVLIWNFNENTDTTTVNDTSTNGNSGTMGGSMTEGDWVPVTSAPVYTNGLGGSTLDFDGSNDNISRADDADLDFAGADSFTLEAWIKHDTQSAGQDIIIAKYETTGADGGYKVLMEADGDITCGIDNDNASFPSDSFTSTAATYDDNNWHHVACVKNGSTSLFLYIDGQIIGTDSAITSATLANDDTFYVGIDGDGSSNAWLGQLDHLVVYRYVRSQAQVSYDYNRGKPVGYWKLDECQGTTANDSGSGSNNGTINIGATGSNTSAGTCSSGVTTEAWNNGTTGKRNASLDFDGSDDYIEQDVQLVSDYPFTISAWVKTISASTRTFFSLVDASAGNIIYALDVDGGVARLFAQNTTIDIISGTTTINDDNWHHVVGIFASATDRKLYVNGNLENTDTSNVTYSSNVDRWDIGRRGDSSPSNGWVGQIDDIRIYNYTLTAAQIRKVFNHGAVFFGPDTGAP